MKHKILAGILSATMLLTAFSGCSLIAETRSELENAKREAMSELRSAGREIESELDDARKEIESELDDAKKDIESELGGKSSTQSSTTAAPSAAKTYTMADVKQLKGTSNFSKNALEHIFDGTINGKGKATGYHYSSITDSKGSIIDGTASEPDEHGVFTAKVQVNGVKKNGFSSFYPADWSPQQVVDAINQAYDDALSDPDNPQGELWIGYSGDLEINMYLDKNKKITTAYPIYEED